VEEKEKGWNMTSNITISARGMVNERFLLNKNIGTKKYYERNKVMVEKEIVEEMETFDEDDW